MFASNFQTDYMGYAVEWSPFNEGQLAVATAQNFGVYGQGKQYVFGVRGTQLKEMASMETKDGCYDCTWSESVADHLCFGTADGGVKLWDLKSNTLLRDYKEHQAEVYAVDWNLVNKEEMVSGAWDNSIKLWHPDSHNSIRTFREHTKCIYSVVWHPKHADMFASTSGDATLKIWDSHDSRSSMTIRAHQYEVLTCDWNKYNEFMIVTGSVDKSIRTWDIRNPKAPLKTLTGHQFAVRRVKCSPHSARLVATASYDMTIGLWDLEAADDALVARYEHHSEFVIGLDFNIFVENQLASASWDETVRIFNINPTVKRTATTTATNITQPTVAPLLPG